MKLTILTPEATLVKDAVVEEVFVPGFYGQLNILPGHAPLITTLQTGALKYRREGAKELQRISVTDGYCEVTPFGVVVLAEKALRPEDVDRSAEESRLKEASLELKGLNYGPEKQEKLLKQVREASTHLSLLN